MQILNANSLIVSLQAVKSAANPEACAQALIGATSLLQSSILNDTTTSFDEAVDGCPAELVSVLRQAMDRALNFHQMDDGRLGLYLMPVVINTEAYLPNVIDMAQTMDLIRVTAALQNILIPQTPDDDYDAPAGWVAVLPHMFSEAQLTNADLRELVALPNEVRRQLQGKQKDVNFSVGSDVDADTSFTKLYYIPFVTFHPTNMEVKRSTTCEVLDARLEKWVNLTLNTLLESSESREVKLGFTQLPYTEALELGDRIILDAELTDLVTNLSNDTMIQPSGIAALVAPYAANNAKAPILGITFVSRLTNQVLLTHALSVSDPDCKIDVALVSHILSNLGVDCTPHNNKIPTMSCQHCGNMQYAVPPAAVTQRGIQHPSQNLH